MKLNTSWKTNTAGIAVILAGVANLVVAAIQHGSVTPEAAGIAVTAVISGIGLLNAKDGNVSNSPTPLQVAQPVEQTLEAAIGVSHVPEVADGDHRCANGRETSGACRGYATAGFAAGPSILT